MRLFLTSEERKLLAGLVDVRDLKDRVDVLLREKKNLGREIELSDQVVTLKTQISNLEIEKSKKTEDHAREERELRHMIGLEKKRQEVEIEQAKKGTALEVREANLTADKQRFVDEMKFQRERMEGEVKYLHEMVEKILQRLPDISVQLNKGK